MSDWERYKQHLRDGLPVMTALPLEYLIKARVAKMAEREEKIIQIMMVFPTHTYNAYPTPEQIEQLLEITENPGERLADLGPYGPDELYRAFCSGCLPTPIDALIKELAVGWRPAGKVVESAFEQRRIMSDQTFIQEQKG